MINFKDIAIIEAAVAILFSFTLIATITTEASTQNDTTLQSEEGSVGLLLNRSSLLHLLQLQVGQL